MKFMHVCCIVAMECKLFARISKTCFLSNLHAHQWNALFISVEAKIKEQLLKVRVKPCVPRGMYMYELPLHTNYIECTSFVRTHAWKFIKLIAVYSAYHSLIDDHYQSFILMRVVYGLLQNCCSWRKKKNLKRWLFCYIINHNKLRSRRNSSIYRANVK